MTDLLMEVDSYLAMRRGLGFKLVDAGSLLPDFVSFLNRHGAEHVSTELSLAWAIQPVNAHPVWWRQRLGMVRGFAEYLVNIDPDTEVPPRELIPARTQRLAPYLYSAADIAALMTVCRFLNPPLRAATYETIIGLLSVTGLRLGEALALNREDIEENQLLLIVRQAKRGGRKVPLHETSLHAPLAEPFPIRLPTFDASFLSAPITHREMARSVAFSAADQSISPGTEWSGQSAVTANRLIQRGACIAKFVIETSK